MAVLVTSNVVNLPVLAIALPTGVFCKPPDKLTLLTVMLPAIIPDTVKLFVLTLPIDALPVTPSVLPIVALLLTVNAFTVVLPATLSPANIGESLVPTPISTPRDVPFLDVIDKLPMVAS